jgi:hypothetical protein
MSDGAANDAQTAKQTMINSAEQSVFTYHIYAIMKVDPEITPTTLKMRLSPLLKIYQQTYILETSSHEIKDAVLFDTIVTN